MKTALVRLNQGASIHYVDEGRGDVVLLLHAFPLHASMWAAQVTSLASTHRVLAPDARGLGRSGPVPTALTMDMIADDAAALLGHLGVQKAVVCGLSMGGYAALALWHRHPHLVAGLGLFDTRAGADTAAGRDGREAFARTALERGMEWVATEMAPKLQRREPWPEVAAQLRQLILANTPAGVAAAQRGMAQRDDFSSRLGDIRCPALVMVGAEDTLTPPQLSRDLVAGIKGSRLVEIPGVGHLANLEAPAAFNEALAEFLRKL